jgi:hypothetical protein
MKKVTDEYKATVLALATAKTDKRFLNDSSNHATLLIELMFDNAIDEDIIIYSGALPSSCFTASLKKTKAKTIRVVLDDAMGLDVISALPTEVQQRITARVIPSEFKGVRGNHFYIAGNAIRYELNHDEATAVANFNEPIANLAPTKERFETLWAAAGAAN